MFQDGLTSKRKPPNTVFKVTSDCRSRPYVALRELDQTSGLSRGVCVFALVADPTSGLSCVLHETFAVCLLPRTEPHRAADSPFICVIYSGLFEEREDASALFSALRARFALNPKVHFSLQDNFKLTTNIKPG